MEIYKRDNIANYFTIWELFHLLVPDKIFKKEFESLLNNDITIYRHAGEIDSDAYIDIGKIKETCPNPTNTKEWCSHCNRLSLCNAEYDVYISNKISDETKKYSTHQSKILVLEKLEKPIEIKFDYSNECYLIKNSVYEEPEKYNPPLFIEDEKHVFKKYDKINRLYIKKEDFEQARLKYPILCDGTYADELTNNIEEKQQVANTYNNKREKRSYLKVVAGLYAYIKKKKPEEIFTERGIPADITKKVQAGGISLSENTVRKIVNEINELYQ